GGDEQAVAARAAEGQVGDLLRQADLAQQRAVGGEALHAVAGAGPDVALNIHAHAVRHPRLDDRKHRRLPQLASVDHLEGANMAIGLHEIIGNAGDLTAKRVDAIDVAAGLLLVRLIALVIAEDAVAGHGDRAVRFSAGDAARTVLAAQHALVGDIAPQQITAVVEPHRPFGPAALIVQALKLGVGQDQAVEALVMAFVEPGEDQPHPGAGAEGVEHAHQQVKKQRGAPDSGDVGKPAGHRSTADDHDGDRRQQVFLAHAQRCTAGKTRQGQATEAAEHGAQHVGREAHPADANAGQFSCASVLTDGQHRATVAGAGQHIPHEHRHTD
nr:hypothetical protein [Tanacetum cinerariifolium]